MLLGQRLNKHRIPKGQSPKVHLIFKKIINMSYYNQSTKEFSKHTPRLA
jgi:hypothetical protein